MGAFHAYDIRGIYNVDFDKTTAYKVGYFVPGLLDADKVLVGRDCRVSSDEIHDSLVQGIMDAGADVYDLGLSSTPYVYFGTAKYAFKASIQITASHNPREDNGMKVSRENALPVGLDSGLGQIKQWIEQGRETPVATNKGVMHEMDIRGEYLDFQRSNMSDYSGLKVAMDLSNGMACLFAKELFGNAPEYIFDEIDGRFPNHDPNPLIVMNVEALSSKVRECRADMGVIYDGDADRVMFTDEKGQFISPDLIIAVLGHWLLEKRGQKGLVLQDIRSSKAVGEYLAPMGAVMATWKVGRAFAAPKLREIDGVFGGELAGHYYFRDFFYSDSGLLSSIFVMNVVAQLKAKGETFSSLISKISKYQNSGEVNFRIDAKQVAMDAVKDHFTSIQTPTAFMDFDGYRVEFPDWWFNIRPSNTEPYLRFICEASSSQLLEDKLAQVKAIIVDKMGGQL